MSDTHCDDCGKLQGYHVSENNYMLNCYCKDNMLGRTIEYEVVSDTQGVLTTVRTLKEAREFAKAGHYSAKSTIIIKVLNEQKVFSID